MARFCTNCGKMLNENARFCPACGVQVRQDPIPQEQPMAQPPVADNDSVQPLEVQMPEYEEAKEIPLQPVEEEPTVFCTAQPVQPEQPEHPVQPEQPEQPVQPVQPEQPEQPEQPVQPVQPEQPTFECRKEDNTAWISSVMSYLGLMLLFAIPGVGLIASIIMSFALKNKNTRNFARAALIFIVVCLLVLCLIVAAGIVLWNEIVAALGEEYGGEIHLEFHPF